MRAVETRTQEGEPANVIAALVVRIAALFTRLPMLSGFSVQDRATLTRDRNMASLDGDLCMLELLDEHPEARELLRGYTFARTFH